MTRYVNLINGVEIPMTEAEIISRKAEEAEWDNNNSPFSFFFLNIFFLFIFSINIIIFHGTLHI